MNTRALLALLLVWPALAAGDQIVVNQLPYADARIMGVEGTTVVFTTAGGAELRKNLADVTRIRLDGDDAFNQAEALAQRGQKTAAAEQYRQALAGAAGWRKALIEARLALVAPPAPASQPAASAPASPASAPATESATTAPTSGPDSEWLLLDEKEKYITRSLRKGNIGRITVPAPKGGAAALSADMARHKVALDQFLANPRRPISFLITDLSQRQVLPEQLDIELLDKTHLRAAAVAALGPPQKTYTSDFLVGAEGRTVGNLSMTWLCYDYLEVGVLKEAPDGPVRAIRLRCKDFLDSHAVPPAP